MNDIDDILELTLLFDFYSMLLTEKQRDIFDMYFNLDYSLQEIANTLDISRQTVFNTIKSCKTNLYSFEEKLGLIDRHNKIKDDVSKSISEINYVLNSFDKNSEYYKKLLNIKNILENID